VPVPRFVAYEVIAEYAKILKHYGASEVHGAAMVRCVHCALVAPVRSEYWSKHACHIWLCPKCCACFSTVVAFPAETEAESMKDILTEDPSLSPSLLVA
jgi:hypothetical protein